MDWQEWRDGCRRTFIRWAPVPASYKAEMWRDFTTRYFAKRIAAARATGNHERADSLSDDERYDLQLLEDEECYRVSTELLRRARRLRLPVPAISNTDETETGFWHRTQATHVWCLSAIGAKLLRDEIRGEHKARHEARAVWVPWLSAMIGLVGALTGLLALWRR